MRATMCYCVDFIVEPLRAQGDRAEPHSLENLINRRCKKNFGCHVAARSYMRSYVKPSTLKNRRVAPLP